MRERFGNVILGHLGGLDLHPRRSQPSRFPEAPQTCCQKSAARNLTSAALAELRETPDGTFDGGCDWACDRDWMRSPAGSRTTATRQRLAGPEPRVDQEPEAHRAEKASAGGVRAAAKRRQTRACGSRVGKLAGVMRNRMRGGVDARLREASSVSCSGSCLGGFPRGLPSRSSLEVYFARSASAFQSRSIRCPSCGLSRAMVPAGTSITNCARRFELYRLRPRS